LTEEHDDIEPPRNGEASDRIAMYWREDGTQTDPQRPSDRGNPLKKGKRRIRPLSRKIIPSFAKYDFKSQMTSPVRQVQFVPLEKWLVDNFCVFESSLLLVRLRGELRRATAQIRR
jgi:hypothetical protein